MKCKEIEDLLFLYGEGECTKEETALVDHHLATCDNCREILALDKELLSTLQSLGSLEQELPEGFHNTLMEKVHALQSPIPKVSWFRRIHPGIYGAAAAMLLLVALLGSFLQPGPSPATGTSESAFQEGAALDAVDSSMAVMESAETPEGAVPEVAMKAEDAAGGARDVAPAAPSKDRNAVLVVVLLSTAWILLADFFLERRQGSR
ncbi:anti-sigma factor family protein [Anaerotalea alkaliphila]|uniref:Anti-sigma-W factor RsiW n=1 Tax=Anaerotalea alkaliphila TaxID=2662126 RepID=A0A7X5HXU5_9FIRM|nr:anti-sigma factor [Anaerotalea alkaliphila]NDL68632.1 hypothetical protein [Anaerotalea alkaliphila]